MVDEQIRDGDYIVVNSRQTAENGEMVVALVRNESATVKKYYREREGRIRLQPANPTMQPHVLHGGRGPHPGHRHCSHSQILRRATRTFSPRLPEQEAA